MSDGTVALIAVLLVLIANLPVVRVVIVPLRLLTTWAHESCHALAAILTGGSVHRIAIFSDGSGLTRFTPPAGRWRKALIVSAGYPGAAAVGALLLWLRHDPSWAEHALQGLCALMVLTVLLWVRNPVGVVSLLVIAGGLAWAAAALGPRDVRAVCTLVGTAISLEALGSFRALFGRTQLVAGSPMDSDATAASRLLWLPAWVWSTSWLLLSLALVWSAW